nr:pre-rRNA-processing protein ESF2 [Cryptomonas curvata]
MFSMKKNLIILQKRNLNYKLKTKRGILFLKNISSETEFKKIKNVFEKFGFISRIFFIKQIKSLVKFKTQNTHQLWGWIEYLNKKDAKQAMSYFKKFILNSNLPLSISVEYLRSFNWEELSNFFY